MVFAPKAAVGVLKQMVCVAGLVITAGLGGASTMIAKVALVPGQLLTLLTSQRMMFVPVARPVTLVKVAVGLTILAVPLCTDQLPVPTAGVVAVITGDG